MNIYSGSDIHLIDAYTIEKQPISSIDLMESASMEFVLEFMHLYSSGDILILAGPGNNGGDALAIARLLSSHHLSISTCLIRFGHKLSPDCQENLDRLQNGGGVVHVIDSEKDLYPLPITDSTVIIDGLFGTGMNRPLAGGYAELVNNLNSTNKRSVISIDIPSGMPTEAVCMDGPIVKADYTFTFHSPKLSFLFPENESCVGKLQVLELPLLVPPEVEPLAYYTEMADVKCKLRERSKFAHKGSLGHALMVAGKKGMAGASLLSTKACLKCGVGKITVRTQESNRIILQLGVPEAVLELVPDDSPEISNDISVFHSVGIGPGIGVDLVSVALVRNLLSECGRPMVIDADALNVIAKHPEIIDDVPQNSILTPHKLELKRLIGDTSNSYDELLKTMAFASKHHIIVVIKGAYSKIVLPNCQIFVNPTGNPGMATAGSGDVLTGMILSLLAQGYSPADAALLGVYLHGLAGDLAASNLGMESVLASDIVNHIPSAFKKVKELDIKGWGR